MGLAPECKEWTLKCYDSAENVCAQNGLNDFYKLAAEEADGPLGVLTDPAPASDADKLQVGYDYLGRPY